MTYWIRYGIYVDGDVYTWEKARFGTESLKEAKEEAYELATEHTEWVVGVSGFATFEEDEYTDDEHLANLEREAIEEAIEYEAKEFPEGIDPNELNS